MSFEILQGDALSVLRTLPAESVHMCVTSPPYWSLRDYGVVGQLGLEAVHDCLGWATGARCGECYICHMVEVFRELRRVLRADGTLWINEGDSYSNDTKWGGQSGGKNYTSASGGYQGQRVKHETPGLKPKDLCGIPWRLALAMQADGWYWRDAIVWHKPAPMPESVRDRCTKSWEPILMFSKSQRYYFDAEAIREPDKGTDHRRSILDAPDRSNGFAGPDTGIRTPEGRNGSGRNKRNVWSLPPMPVSEAHFATFPLELPETCILAGTSERGVCPKCGAPWIRELQKTEVLAASHNGSRFDQGKTAGRDGGDRTQAGDRWLTSTTGWHPGCNHGGEPVPATVLDSFCGTATTLLAALKHGRNFLGIELSGKYIEIARRRADKHFSLFAEAACS